MCVDDDEQAQQPWGERGGVNTGHDGATLQDLGSVRAQIMLLIDRW
jgi:hypothetical protein